MKQPMKLTPMEYSTVIWHWVTPVGQKLEDVLKPSYWQHVTAQLRPGHEVKVVSEDRTMWAHLLVRDVGKQEAVMGVILAADFDSDVDRPVDELETYVKWRSPKSRYGVFRKSDDECLKDGFETKENALVWAVDREQGLAA